MKILQKDKKKGLSSYTIINIMNYIFQYIKNLIIKNRRTVVIFVHLIQAAIAHYLALIIRFETIFVPTYSKMLLSYLPILLSIRLILFLQAGLYKDLWRYSSISDMIKIVKSSTLGSMLFFIVIRYLIGNTAYPRSIYILDCLLLIIISGGSRLFIRVFREYIHSEHQRKKILIVGAGDAGENIVREIKNDPKSPYKPIGFIDEDPLKKGLMIHGVPIFGPISLIPYIIENDKPDEILITTASTNNNNIKKIYDLSKPYNTPIKKLPIINDLIDGKIAMVTKLGQRLIDANLVTEEKVQQALSLQKKEGGRLGSKLIKLGHISEEVLISFLNKQFGILHMKPISLEDLLQREPVKTDTKSIRDFIQNKSVLVTGAGGTIGSELCRQIRKHYPFNLILLDRYENGLFEMNLELTCNNGKYNGEPQNNIIPVIGDINDISILDSIFLKYKPQIIFHAAAYKHVPLMEFNPVEAVKNNIIGTKKLLDNVSKYDAENFVMISTDKAVNPTSIMGATKRVAEFLTTAKNTSSRTKFTTVRFGNVLGSSGSVIPIFKQQLKNGGPLTVTHPEIKRFFMLIPEAVQLVLVAAASGNGGQIFVLDMGNPIKISELAENLIRLSGFIPDEEIKIKYIGLRPGEKMYEELFDSSEKIIPTFHEKLMITVPEPILATKLDELVSEFEQIVQKNSINDITPTIQKIIPNFKNEANLTESLS